MYTRKAYATREAHGVVSEAEYRFYALYDKISREDILAHAYAQCRSNKGAPGVDGQNFAYIDAYGVRRWLGELALTLRQETYRPDPIRRVFIPKANGKLRPLGISTLRDRVCMTAALLVLEPIFEADLPPEQYAYRPGRKAQQAVIEVEGLLFRGQTHRKSREKDGSLLLQNRTTPLATRAGLCLWHLTDPRNRTSRFSRARPRTLPAARGNGSHQRLFAIKEQGFHVATLDRPLTSRTAVLLGREQGELRLSRRFSLFTSKLEDFFPSVALAIDHDKGRRHLKSLQQTGHRALRSSASSGGR
jgi:hypothetical protein